MYELIQVVNNTYYINCPAKIGIYRSDHNEVYLIDSGNDKDAAKKILKIIAENGWKVKAIINTHSHADHIGGNNLIQKRTGCDIFAYGREVGMIQAPDLEPAYLYGGFPAGPLQNKFLMAEPSLAKDIREADLPVGMDYLKLPGHAPDMIGIKTPDDVYFLADAVARPEIIKKYHVIFLYNLKEYLNTLELLPMLKGRYYIPSHTEVVTDLQPLCDVNRQKALEIMDLILNLCEDGISQEVLIGKIFQHYRLHLDFNQYVLIGSTIRSYLSYLQIEGKLDSIFEPYCLKWKTIRETA